MVWFDHLLPHFYIIYGILLVHRIYRDDLSKNKYGRTGTLPAAVPYKLLPGVF